MRGRFRISGTPKYSFEGRDGMVCMHRDTFIMTLESEVFSLGGVDGGGGRWEGGETVEGGCAWGGDVPVV